MIIITRNGEYVEKNWTEEEFYTTSLPLKGWTIYTGEWPIPPDPPTLDEAKQAASLRVRTGWQSAVRDGYLTSAAVSDFVIDVRRNETDNDIQNIESMIALVNAGLVSPPVPWKGKTETRSLTLAELENLRLEMLAYGAQVYSKKFTLLAQVDAATTVEECEAITW